MNEALKSIGFQSINRGIGCMVQQELNMWDQSQTHTLPLPRPSTRETNVCIKLAVRLHKPIHRVDGNAVVGFGHRPVTQN